VRNKDTLDQWGQQHNWSADEFPLFSANLMTTYSRRMADQPRILRQVQAETNPYGGIVWVACCENGWIIESFGPMDHNAPLMPIVQKWLAGDKS
jgi:hypothetical protein